MMGTTAEMMIGGGQASLEVGAVMEGPLLVADGVMTLMIMREG